VTRDGRDTSYAYDGLGRQASSTDTTQYGSDTTTTVFNGLTPVQQADRLHGTTTMVRDAAGRLAQHINGDGGASWELLDRLGSTVAGAQGGSIIQLSSYSDWGDQAFATTGWNAPENYTGEQNDASQGLNHYYARSYDPATGTWASPDTWVGLIQQPQSLHRYAYVQNDPTTFIDALGNRLSDPSAYATPAKGCSISNPKCGGGYVHAPPPVKPKAPAAPPHIPKKKSPPKPKAPTQQSKESKRHEGWKDTASWLNIASAAVGVLAVASIFIPGAQVLTPFLVWGSVGLSAAAAAVTCSHAWGSDECSSDIVATAGGAVGAGLGGLASGIIRSTESVAAVSNTSKVIANGGIGATVPVGTCGVSLSKGQDCH
jgi:RHS repeat-associated protein